MERYDHKMSDNEIINIGLTKAAWEKKYMTNTFNFTKIMLAFEGSASIVGYLPLLIMKRLIWDAFTMIAIVLWIYSLVYAIFFIVMILRYFK